MDETKTTQLQLVTYQKDAFIVVEGRRADKFYIIKEGQALTVKSMSAEKPRVLTGGSFFGVEAALSGHSHLESVQAATQITLIAVERNQILDLIQRNNVVAMKIISDFSRQVRHLNETLARSDTEDAKQRLKDTSIAYFKLGRYIYACQALQRFLQQEGLSEEERNMAQAALEKTLIKTGAKTCDGLKAVTRDERTKIFKENSMIFVEGEIGTEFYVILSGEVRITRISEGKELTIAMLHAGDILGEMALLDNNPRSANAIAMQETVVSTINRQTFKHIVASEARMTVKIMRALADRIWLTDKHVANMQIADPLTRLYDGLITELEKANVDVYSIGSYTFPIQLDDLYKLTGLSYSEELNNKLFADKNLRLNRNHIIVTDVQELHKKTSSLLLVNRKRVRV